MSELSVGTLSGLAANSYVIDVASGSQLTQPGMILQVVSTTKTDSFTTSVAGVFSTNVTGLEATITPSSTASKILVSVNVAGMQQAYAGLNYRVMRDSTGIGVGDAEGSRSQVSSGSEAGTFSDRVASSSVSILDSPATTSAITYGVQLFNRSGSTVTYYVNRALTDTDSSITGRYASSITLMEVAA